MEQDRLVRDQEPAVGLAAVITKHVLVFAELCHGCGGCTLLYPEGAITEVGQEIGIVERGHADNVEFVHRKINVGEAMSGPVIKEVKKHINGQPFVFLDAPPGTSSTVLPVKGVVSASISAR